MVIVCIIIMPTSISQNSHNREFKIGKFITEIQIKQQDVMGSENLNAPPYRVILIVISVVVSLHILTAVAIVMVKPPLAIIEEEKRIAPIEIQLLSPPPKPETPKPSVEKVAAEPVTESVQPHKKIIEQSKPQSKPKPVDTVKPVVAASKPVSKPVSKPKVNKPTEVKKVVKQDPAPLAPKVDTITSTKIAEQQAEQQRQKVLAAQAHAKAMQQAQQREVELAKLEAQRAAQAKQEAQAAANANAKAARDAAEKAAQAAEEKAAKKAKEAAEKAKAASNEPVSYGTIGNSSWLREPIFTSIRNNDYGFQGTEVSVSVSMSVDANGNIGNIKISQSSGNNKFDKDFIRALSKAKLNPATRDNTPIKSTAILPFRMNL